MCYACLISQSVSSMLLVQVSANIKHLKVWPYIINEWCMNELWVNDAGILSI